MNSLTLDEQMILWIPTIVFWNTKDQLRTINDKTTFSTIIPEGNGTIIGKEINKDIETFDGSENTISISRVYSIQFFCEYDMAWYPLDIQTCTIEMVMDGVLENYADLLPGDLVFSGPQELTQYFVQDFKIELKIIKTKVAVVVSITLGRRLLGTFLTIFFPINLLNIIGCATNLFKPFIFKVSQYHFSLCYLFLNVSGCYHYEPDLHVGVDNHVYQREQQPTQDFLHEDCGCVAPI